MIALRFPSNQKLIREKKVVYKSDRSNSFHLPNGGSVRYRTFGGPENRVPPLTGLGRDVFCFF